MKKQEVSQIRRHDSKLTVFVYYSVLCVASVVILIPFLWMVSTSFDYVRSYGLPYPPRLIPADFSTFNYQIAFQNMPIFRYMLNTLSIAALSVIFNILLATLTGFCLSIGQFKGKSIILLFILSNMMIPFETKLMPTFLLIQSMGLHNSFMGVVLPSVLTSAIYVFFIKKYCDDLPRDLYEAGIIDGANKLVSYGVIYLPLMGPAIATVSVLTVINSWNDLLWPMVVLTKTELKTVQIGLALYSNDIVAAHAGVATALSVVSIIPLALIFIFLQRYIVQSVAATGIKQ